MNSDEISRKLELVLKELNEIKKRTTLPSNYYRNKDLKKYLGLSPNTIIKYREEGILPYTIIGEIYLYPIDELNKVLLQNLSK